MITYIEKPYGIIVRLDGKRVGTILKDPDGYYYLPYGSTTKGQVYSTLAEVKRSLESD